MLEITSVSNNLVKETTKLQQKKFRKQSGLFLLEGYKPIFEAILSNVQIEKIFVTQHHFEKFSKLIKRISLRPTGLPLDVQNLSHADHRHREKFSLFIASYYFLRWMEE